MKMMERRGKCLRIQSEKMQFRVSYVNATPNRSAAARWNGLRAQTPARSSPLQTKYSWCESESGFKKEIPV
jgi:hypothetical protein